MKTKVKSVKAKKMSKKSPFKNLGKDEPQRPEARRFFAGRTKNSPQSNRMRGEDLLKKAMGQMNPK